MRRRMRLLCVVMVICWLAGHSIAATTESIPMGATVTAVDAKKKRATLDRGKAAGLKVGLVGDLFVMGQDDAIDFDVRVARGKVVELTDKAAVVALDAIGGELTVGGYFEFTATVPSELARLPLFRVVARSITMTHYDGTRLTTIEEMLADPSRAVRAQELMLLELHIESARFATFTEPIKDGPFRGKLAVDVVKKLDLRQLEQFLVHIDEFPGRSVGRTEWVGDWLMGWLQAGAPSGEESRQLRLAEPANKAAAAAAASGKFDEARKLWRALLTTVPNHQDATDGVARIDRILVRQRQLVADPDNTSARYELMNELDAIGAHALAMGEYPALHKAGYEPQKVEAVHARALIGQENWSQALDVTRRLAKQNPDDETLSRNVRFAQASSKLAKSPEGLIARLELAAIAEEMGDYDAALKHYRRGLESMRATAKQREVAALAQPRISTLRKLEQHVEWTNVAVRAHQLDNARDRVSTVRDVANNLVDPKRAIDMLSEIAETAQDVAEYEFSNEMLEYIVTLAADRQRTHVEMAWNNWALSRLDAAAAAARKALTLKGDRAGDAHLILAQIAQVRSDFVESEKQARLAVEPGDARPPQQLARIDAAADHWQDALEHARKGLESDTDFGRATQVSVALGLQAHEALQANSSSARERLRLVRALAGLGLVKRVGEEIAKLPADGAWRTEGWWALAVSKDPRIQLPDKLTAARNAKPTVEYRKRRLALLEARAKVEANPTDEDLRITLAGLYLKSETYENALVTLGPVAAKASAIAIAGDARQAIIESRQLELATEANAREDHETAVRLIAPGMALRDRLDLAVSRTKARLVVVSAFAGLGSYANAIALTEATRPIAVAFGDPTNVTRIDEMMGQLNANLGTNDDLQKALATTLKVCDELDDALCLFWAYAQSVDVDRDAGKVADAIEDARKALRLAERIGRADRARWARAALAAANLGAGRYSDAEDAAGKLLAESRKAADLEHECSALMILGESASARGQGKAARARLKEAYEVSVRAGRSGWRADAHRAEGRSWMTADHDPKRAATAFEQADALTVGDTAERGTTLQELAVARLQAGDVAGARKAADEGVALAKRFQRRLALISGEWLLARVALAETKVDEALTHATASLDLARQTDDAQSLANAWHVLARAQAAKGKDSEALDSYDKALENLNRVMLAAGGSAAQDGVMSAGETRGMYKDAVAHLLRLGKTRRAMEVLDLSRDAQLRQTFDPTQAQPTDPKARARLDSYQKTRVRVNGLEKQLGAAMNKPGAQRSETQIKALGQQIARTREELKDKALDLKLSHRHLYDALAMEPNALVDRRGELPKDSVVVEYFMADDALYAFVVSAALTQPAIVKVTVSSTELATVIGEFRDAIVAENNKVKQRDKVDALGRKLDDWLLEPLRPYLTGATTLIVLPFGSINYVPFDALVVSEPGAPIRYAIEDFRISIQTKTTLEFLLRPAAAPRTGTMLAVANPDGSLPAAQREVTRIVKSMPDARVLGKTQATVQKFKDMVGAFRYVHLATHGVVEVDARKTYLKLSDGNLTIKDIAQLKGIDQTNELVVLSACETAMEKGGASSDEQVTLAIAFAMAGAPTLVASLWKVGDESTAELMSTFYRALEGGGDRLEALRTAKLNLLRMKDGKTSPYAAPWHWASFQLLGDFRAPTVK